jgi:energy-coupling factor transport system permease protein
MRLPESIPLMGYIPGETFLHRLDPRVKLVAFVLVSAGALLANTAAGVALAAGLLIGLAGICSAGWRIWLAGLLRFAWMLGIVAVVNVVFNASGRPVFLGGRELPFSVEGLQSAGILTFRVAALIVASMVLMFTTTPTELTRGLQRLAAPLKRLGVPCDEIALIVVLALRFIPMLQEELRTTIDAQKARGIDLGAGGLVVRAGSLVSVLVPALIGALRRGDLLAVAMAARGYRPGIPRSEYRPLRCTHVDVIALACSILFFLCQMLVFR